MPYSAFVGVALAIHILINIDMFAKRDNIPAIKSYRMFLVSIAVFYLTDILWGIFEAGKLAVALYADTFIYFVSMGSTIMLWTRFVIRYLDGNKIFSNIVRITGVAFFAAELILLIVNIFVPVLFTVDQNAVYEAYEARHIMLWAQIAMYSLVSIYSFIVTFLKYRKLDRRYVAIFLFGVVMITCIAIQLGDPYIPFYSIGCLIGVCILDAFALNDTKERFKHDLEKDALTNTNSRYAYVSKEENIDKQISNNTIKDFAVIVFDINGLKRTNDLYGHQAGDKYIIDSAKTIEMFFPASALYRFGGDEFVVILEGEQINNYEEQCERFKKHIDENLLTNKPIVSSGYSRYIPDKDFAFKTVFIRADKMMYNRKEALKKEAKQLKRA